MQFSEKMEIRTPCSDHVKVEKRSKCSEECASGLESLNPRVEGEHEQKDRNSFVVVGSCDGTRNVSRGDADERSREQTSALILHLLREPGASVSKATGEREAHAHIGRPGREGTEARREEDANVADVDREVECVKNVVNDAAGGHQARIDGASYNTPKRVPGSVVKPIPERLQM